MVYGHSLRNLILSDLPKKSRKSFISSPGPNLASVVVVNILQKSSPLKLQDQFQPNFIQLFFRVLATILSFKMFNMSKNMPYMAAVTKNRTRGSESSFSQITQKQKRISKFRESKVVQHDKIYLLCDFCDDPCRSYCPFLSVFFQIFKL